MTHSNRSPLYTLATHDFRNATRAGYDVFVRADGTIRVESVNRWEGSMTGVVWIAPAPEPIMVAARGEQDDDEAPDIETLLHDWLATDWQATAKRIRVGYRVR